MQVWREHCLVAIFTALCGGVGRAFALLRTPAACSRPAAVRVPAMHALSCDREVAKETGQDVLQAGFSMMAGVAAAVQNACLQLRWLRFR
jgi:hypothetical protein